MNKVHALAGIALCLLPAAAQAAPAKALAKPGKMVTLYQAEKCHMYFTPAQAKIDKYACPDSKGKMHMVKMTPDAAEKALGPVKKTPARKAM